MEQGGTLEAIQQTIRQAATLDELKEIRNQWVGRKGRITEQMKELSRLAPDLRRERGAELNAWRESVLAALTRREEELVDLEERRALVHERLDLTIPGRRPEVGLLHPLTRVRRRIEDVFLRLGFSLAYGPQVESEWYNFEALNIPPDHPARDMQDSFFVDVPGLVLRTHTSPVQIRSMQRHQGKLPVKIIAPGLTYRRDDDATHVPMFQQVEGLVVDEGISLADLTGTLTVMAQELFGDGVDTRFRSSYFPFTEPSVEMDVTCAVCRGAGCRVCKETGWVEILGSGVVHPVVLENGGYDPSIVTGFAFGMGIERIAMRIFGLDDLRLLYQNDVRYLDTFQSGEGDGPGDFKSSLA
ncbi:MAG: phenylalanine--tRNA ligase subunit alpha [Sulfobacillus acidophilus]|uniref:Phenylalanine--tRNA ligase alpha subunit n=1 Tax=Sulfobacillus acidophilus TaxID=53633 RepID=A0A2T2WIT6_9FIRM|nr:MAG: phenylalanine--tRNA ligase subunit alpha [Sulfobacillus acidophilus]